MDYHSMNDIKLQTKLHKLNDSYSIRNALRVLGTGVPHSPGDGENFLVGKFSTLTDYSIWSM